jgi:CRISPR-associated protein Cas5d
MKSPTYIIKAEGPFAIFTRPEFKSERFSYPCITPSAARGLIEAILWKPSIAWHIEKIHLLKPIKWTSFRRNEVGSKASAPSRTVLEKGGSAPVLYADRDRVMRNTVALQDVDYAIECHFTMTERAGPEENTMKFHEMFIRRVSKGQSFQQPYFGCRECVANLELLQEIPDPIALDKDLGIMLWDIDYRTSTKGERNVPIFFHVHVKNGTIDVPPNREAAQQSLLNNTIGSC